MAAVLGTVPLLLAVAIGAGFGRWLPPRRPRRGAWPPRLWGIALAGALLLLVVDVIDVPGSASLRIVALAALIAGAVLNLRMVGMGVVTVGLALNLAVTVLNLGYPMRVDALVDSGLVTRVDEDGRPVDLDLLGGRELESDGTLLGLLGGVIPIGLTEQVLSFGDLILLVGSADVVANVLRQRRWRPPVERGVPRQPVRVQLDGTIARPVQD